MRSCFVDTLCVFIITLGGVSTKQNLLNVAMLNYFSKERILYHAGPAILLLC